MTTRTVPLSPTAGMRMAGSLAIKHHYAREGGWCGILAAEEQMMLTWRAMIAAAPAEPDPAADPRLVREFKLEAELAASQERVRELDGNLDKVASLLNDFSQQADDQRRRAEKAEQERDALAKDVERYRWLRDDKYWADICRPVHGNDCEHVAGVELDSVIDAAIISGRDAT